MSLKPTRLRTDAAVMALEMAAPRRRVTTGVVVTWLERPVDDPAARRLRYAEATAGTAVGGRRTLASRGAVEPASLPASPSRLVAFWRAASRCLRPAEWRAPRR